MAPAPGHAVSRVAQRLAGTVGAMATLVALAGPTTPAAGSTVPSGPSDPAATTAGPATADTTPVGPSVGVVLDGPSDFGYGGSLVSTLQAMRLFHLVGELTVRPGVTAADAPAAIDQLVATAHAVVVVRGVDLGSAVRAAAAAHPGVTLVYFPGGPPSATGDPYPANVAVVTADLATAGAVMASLPALAGAASWSGAATPTGDDAAFLDAFTHHAGLAVPPGSGPPVTAAPDANFSVRVVAGDRPPDSASSAPVQIELAATVDNAVPEVQYVVTMHESAVLLAILGHLDGVYDDEPHTLTLDNCGLTLGAGTEARQTELARAYQATTGRTLPDCNAADGSSG